MLRASAPFNYEYSIRFHGAEGKIPPTDPSHHHLQCTLSGFHSRLKMPQLVKQDAKTQETGRQTLKLVRCNKFLLKVPSINMGALIVFGIPISPFTGLRSPARRPDSHLRCELAADGPSSPKISKSTVNLLLGWETGHRCDLDGTIHWSIQGVYVIVYG